MNRIAPPVLLQTLLHALLSARDQETVVGDLLEVYVERRSRDGMFRANLWYAAQAASFAPRAAFRAYLAAPALVLLCCFTALCAAWLGTMSIRLHHVNLYQESIAGLIFGQAMLTLIMLPLRRFQWLRWAAALGAAAIAWLGGSAFLAIARGDHSFEGYILLISLLLIVQAGMTWSDLLRKRTSIA